MEYQLLYTYLGFVYIRQGIMKHINPQEHRN